MSGRSDTFRPMTTAWLALVALTLSSLALGTWFHADRWLPALVAVIIWVKGVLVARHFIEAHLAHPFIRRLLGAFIVFAPVVLAATSFFAGTVARWTTLW